MARKIDLEISFNSIRNGWSIAELGGSEPPYGVFPTQAFAQRAAAVLARFLARHVNKPLLRRTKGSCEVYTRHLDGTWTKDTYGYDPRKSKN